MTTEALLTAAYAAYNGQDVDGLLAVVSDDVDWPEGSAIPGRLHGKDAVAAYWKDQWTRTRSHDRPVHVTRLSDGRFRVRIDQVVRAPDGSVISSGEFDHVHVVQDSCIVRMDIEGVHVGATYTPAPA